MREILFRGKLLTGNWVQGKSISALDDESVFIFPDDGLDSPDHYEVDPETVGQYTGLKDKNGEKIFEVI